MMLLSLAEVGVDGTKGLLGMFYVSGRLASCQRCLCGCGVDTWYLVEPADPAAADREAFTVPAGVCPVCAMKFSYATEAAGRGGPAPGDVTVCSQCFSIFRLSERLTLEIPPAEVVEALARNPKIAQIRDALMRAGSVAPAPIRES